MALRTLIIGGVAGGSTTAARLRRRDESMDIVIFEKGDYISYANCGLPYYIGDVITDRDQLLLQSPELMKNRYNIDVRCGHEVTKILPEERAILVKNLKTGEETREAFDDLVIATGSTPIRPNLEGADMDGIFTLWNLPDTDRIYEYMKNTSPKSAVVIGGGFIGLEMAENLKHKGLNVTIVEKQKQLMTPLDEDMARLVYNNIMDNGTKVLLEDGVTGFKKN
nr:FAD-dependent oxidoreductase [Lachnospiraceae bacterium]